MVGFRPERSVIDDKQGNTPFPQLPPHMHVYVHKTAAGCRAQAKPARKQHKPKHAMRVPRNSRSTTTKTPQVKRKQAIKTRLPPTRRWLQGGEGAEQWVSASLTRAGCTQGLPPTRVLTEAARAASLRDAAGAWVKAEGLPCCSALAGL